MRGKAHRPGFTLLVIAALGTLLALLAVLQYRWMGQISAAERQTMQTYVRNQTRGLQEDINQEIDRATSRLRISVDALRKESWHELIEQYEGWRSTATYPDLIKDLFLARVDANGKLGLLHLDRPNGRFEPVDWPEGLADIRRHFEPIRRPLSADTERQEKEQESMLRAMIERGYIVEDLPAVVRLAVGFRRREEPKSSEAQERFKAVTIEAINESPLTITVLDADYLKNIFIPSLFRRRFTTDGALDYELLIAYRKPVERRLEKGDSEFSSDQTGDAAANVFVAALNSSESSRGPRWQLIISHRAGSLDAAVAQARTRNLITSFGILSLLAISVIIVIVISRRAQKLARKQMDFIAGVSHEFRTPLAVIHAISENLADGLITDQQQIEQCAVVIRNDTRRLSGMVEQVLEFAGASRGKDLYQPQPVDVSDMIEQALAANPVLGTQNDWRIEKQIQTDVPPVLADPKALASAVRNIIDNAVKYSGEKHWLGITAKRRANNNHAPTVEITIADRGIGIPESDLPHIFEPFYRGREVVAAQVHGNGLGLSLVKNIVEAHGGTIAVSSVPGEGSAFRLSLPAANG